MDNKELLKVMKETDWNLIREPLQMSALKVEAVGVVEE
jgi:hypothetical protein